MNQPLTCGLMDDTAGENDGEYTGREVEAKLTSHSSMNCKCSPGEKT